MKREYLGGGYKLIKDTETLDDAMQKYNVISGLIFLNLESNYYKQRLSNTKSRNSDNVLKIGCGSGAFINNLTTEEAVNKIYGVNTSESS